MGIFVLLGVGVVLGIPTIALIALVRSRAAESCIAMTSASFSGDRQRHSCRHHPIGHLQSTKNPISFNLGKTTDRYSEVSLDKQRIELPDWSAMPSGGRELPRAIDEVLKSTDITWPGVVGRFTAGAASMRESPSPHA
jgi:hypothetical protein